MATFLAMDELKTEDFAIRLYNLFKKSHKNTAICYQLQPFSCNL
jgi:hypothetical protein